MKTVRHLLFVSFLVLIGCEGSPFPLGDPADSAIDENLIGSWVLAYAPDEVRDETEDGSYLNVLPFNEHEYYVEGWDKGEEDEMMKMSVFSTEVQGVLFANIRCINCDEDDRDEYFFFSYDLAEDGDLSVRSVSDDIYKDLKDMKSVREVRRYFERHMTDADFYDDEAAVYRKGDVDS